MSELDDSLAVMVNAGVPAVAVESVRTRPTMRTVFPHAKIVGVMSGGVIAATPAGEVTLTAGDVLVVGTGIWCSLQPIRRVRTWTIHVDETFLRSYSGWALPPAERLRPGTHPSEWDGSMRVHHPGLETLRRIDPLVRQMSLAGESGDQDTARAVVLRHFAAAVELMVPALLAEKGTSATATHERRPVVGRLSSAPVRTEALCAAELLKERLAEAWTVSCLAAEVSISASHLPAIFRQAFGVPPIRYLNELRLTAFVRLIEETDMPLSLAASTVGWRDSRVAAARFRRRYGLTPSEYRRHPQRAEDDEDRSGVVTDVKRPMMR